MSRCYDVHASKFWDCPTLERVASLAEDPGLPSAADAGRLHLLHPSDICNASDLWPSPTMSSTSTLSLPSQSIAALSDLSWSYVDLPAQGEVSSFQSAETGGMTMDGASVVPNEGASSMDQVQAAPYWHPVAPATPAAAVPVAAGLLRHAHAFSTECTQPCPAQLASNALRSQLVYGDTSALSGTDSAAASMRATMQLEADRTSPPLCFPDQLPASRQTMGPTITSGFSDCHGALTSSPFKPAAACKPISAWKRHQQPLSFILRAAQQDPACKRQRHGLIQVGWHACCPASWPYIYSCIYSCEKLCLNSLNLYVTSRCSVLQQVQQAYTII